MDAVVHLKIVLRLRLCRYIWFRCYVDTIIIPVSDLIRLNILDILRIKNQIDWRLYSNLIMANIKDFRFNWDIDLVEIHDYREDLIDQEKFYLEKLSNEGYFYLLYESGPKFFWRLSVDTIPLKSANGKKIIDEDIEPICFFELHVDASGINHNISIRRTVIYNNYPELNNIIKNSLNDYGNNFIE